MAKEFGPHGVVAVSLSMGQLRTGDRWPIWRSCLKATGVTSRTSAHVSRRGGASVLEAVELEVRKCKLRCFLRRAVFAPGGEMKSTWLALYAAAILTELVSITINERRSCLPVFEPCWPAPLIMRACFRRRSYRWRRRFAIILSIGNARMLGCWEDSFALPDD
jgi:hypothetical protein